MLYVKLKPNMDIYNINLSSDYYPLIEHEELSLYAGKDITFTTIDGDSYNLVESLEKNLITKENIKSFLERESSINRIQKYDLKDGTIIYKNNNYTIISCYNEDMYIGKPNLQTELQGKYCGYDEKPCYYTKTYTIVGLYPYEEFEYYTALVKAFQGPYRIIVIPKDNYDLNSWYEFTYYTYDSFENNYSYSYINNMPNFSFPYEEKLVSIKKTDKLGLEQKQQPACLTK